MRRRYVAAFVLMCGLAATDSQVARAETQSIDFELAQPGRVSINIYDRDGAIVRNLVNGSPCPAGTHRRWWDGLDDHGRPVPAGEYGWKSLATPGFRAEHVMSIGSTWPAGEEWWMQGPGNMRGPRAITSDAGGIYVSAGMSENVNTLIKISRDGKRRLASGWQPTAWDGAVAMNVAGKSLYVLGHLGKLYRLPTDKFNPFGTSAEGWDVRIVQDKLPFDADPTVPAAMSMDMAAALIQGETHLAVSYRDHDLVRRLDARTGSVVAEIVVPRPRGLAFEPDGSLLLLSGTSLLKVAAGEQTPRPVLDGLVEPLRVAVDPVSRDLLVVEAGASQQIKRFDAAGTPRAVYGRLGGREHGLYDRRHFRDVCDIEADGEGGFYVVETGSPRRTAQFDRNGDFQQEWYGGSAGLASPLFLERPNDPSVVWYNSHWGEWTRAIVDLKTRTWQVHSTYRTHGMARGLVVDWNSRPYTPVEAEGRTYFMSQERSSRGGHRWVLLLDRERWRLKPVSVIDSHLADSIEAKYAECSYIQELHRQDPDRRRAYQWTDADGDGEPQPEEFTWYDRAWGNRDRTAGGPDLSWNSGVPYYQKQGEAALWRVSLEGFNAVGSPRYADPTVPTRVAGYPADAVNIDKSSLWRFGRPGEPFYEAYNLVPIGYRWTTGWGNTGGNRILKRAGDGRPLWQLRPPQSIENIYDERARKLAPGEVGKIRGFAVCRHGVIASGKDGAWNGNSPTPVYCWDHDGLWAGSLFETPGSVDWATRDQAWRYQLGSEPWWIEAAEDAEGRVHVIGNWENEWRVYRIDGWEGWERSAGSITLASASVPAGSGLSAEYRRATPAGGAPSVRRIDGQAAWDGSTPSNVPEPTVSATWTGRLIVPRDDEYTLVFSAGGAARLWFDRGLLLHRTNDDGESSHEFPLSLKSGRSYDLRIDVEPAQGPPIWKLEWRTPAEGKRAVPTEVMFPNRIDETQGDSLPARIPGIVEAEDFVSGAGRGYHDLDAANRLMPKTEKPGAVYRPGEQVDLGEDWAPGRGRDYFVRAQAGERLDYVVEVAEEGTYDVEFALGNVGSRSAGVDRWSSKGGGVLHLELDGRPLGESVTIPAAAGQPERIVVRQSGLVLKPGRRRLRVVFDRPGNVADWPYVGDLHHLAFRRR